jgi:F-type H+-transporting ATPase subunit a
MEGLEFLKEKGCWHLFGLQNDFFKINSSIVIDTWIALLIILAILIPCYIILKRKPGIAHFAVTNTVNFFVDMTKQALGYFDFKHFSFIASVFIFILVCNVLSLIPWLEEPTIDPNTTLAIGIIQFFYIQYYTIKTHGPVAYAKEYFEPIFLMFPLHVVSKLASIISISFRLFGNIFGGFIISSIYFGIIQGSWWKESFGIFSGMNFVIRLFFGIFEGFLQAFVFTMLTVTYLSMALQSDHAEKEGKPSC